MWSNVVEETGEPGENHRTWTGDHYPATCLDPDSNPDRRGDKLGTLIKHDEITCHAKEP